MVFLRLPFEKGVKCVEFGNGAVNVAKIQYHVASCWGVNDLKLYYNGKVLEEHHVVPGNATLQAAFSLPGGKGGFGSMLRAIGAQIEKTTNREACRDLSGRRLRDINEEQRLKKWIAKESEREAEKARRRKERIERLKSKPRHNFVDFEYEKEISKLPERVDDALHAGMEKASKRPQTVEACTAAPSKKKKLWLDDDISGSSDSDSQEPSTSGNTTSHANNSHSSSESSNDSCVVESKLDNSAEKRLPMVVDSEEETSLDCNAGKQQVSLNADASQESGSPQEEVIGNEEAAREQMSSSPSSDEQMTSDINTGASCSSTTNEVDKVADSSLKVDETTVDSQPAAEDQIEDVDLVSYESASELESLGLEKLKAALMARGLKCGGSVSDRAQRLWKVRGLEPHEYPSNLLAKKKKSE